METVCDICFKFIVDSIEDFEPLFSCACSVNMRNVKPIVEDTDEEPDECIY